MSNESSSSISSPARAPRSHKPLYFIGGALLLNAAVMLFSHFSSTPDILLDRAAFAQALPTGNAPQLLGARGIYMMPAQLGPQTYGLYLMDVDAGTICVYRANPDISRFRLMAARSFRNDRFLEDYNNETPTPHDVQRLVDNQRQRQTIENRTNQSTVDQAPKPDENAPDTAPAR